MATPFEEIMARGSALRLGSKRADEAPTADTQAPSLEPFINELSFEQILLLGKGRRQGLDDTTALQNVFGEGRTVLG